MAGVFLPKHVEKTITTRSINPLASGVEGDSVRTAEVRQAA
jgi:hypothetical protein